MLSPPTLSLLCPRSIMIGNYLHPTLRSALAYYLKLTRDFLIIGFTREVLAIAIDSYNAPGYGPAAPRFHLH